MDASISDQAVAAATGRDWHAWLEILRSAEREGPLSHREIARLLHERFGVSYWWSQTIAGEYEKRTGRRETGEVPGSGFQVGVSRTLPFPAGEGWRRLLSPAGLKWWLGECDSLTTEEGAAYRTADGIRGEIRVWRPESHLRLTWMPASWKSPSTLQLRCRDRGDGRCVISFHQEKLSDGETRESMRRRWKEALNGIATLKTSE